MMGAWGDDEDEEKSGLLPAPPPHRGVIRTSIRGISAADGNKSDDEDVCQPDPYAHMPRGNAHIDPTVVSITISALVSELCAARSVANKERGARTVKDEETTAGYQGMSFLSTSQHSAAVEEQPDDLRQGLMNYFDLVIKSFPIYHQKKDLPNPNPIVATSLDSLLSRWGNYATHVPGTSSPVIGSGYTNTQNFINLYKIKYSLKTILQILLYPLVYLINFYLEKKNIFFLFSNAAALGDNVVTTGLISQVKTKNNFKIVLFSKLIEVFENNPNINSIIDLNKKNYLFYVLILLQGKRVVEFNINTYPYVDIFELLKKTSNKNFSKHLSEVSAPENLSKYIDFNKFKNEIFFSNLEIEKFNKIGLLNDLRFAEASAANFRRLGLSERMIRAKLVQKGLSSAVINQSFQLLKSNNLDSELTASIIFSRRRRIGAFRGSKNKRQKFYAQDMARMARAGFSYYIAQKVIGIENREELEQMVDNITLD